MLGSLEVKGHPFSSASHLKQHVRGPYMSMLLPSRRLPVLQSHVGNI